MSPKSDSEVLAIKRVVDAAVSESIQEVDAAVRINFIDDVVGVVRGLVQDGLKRLVSRGLRDIDDQVI